MGSSFTNIQIYNKESLIPQQVRDRLIAYYRKQGKSLACDETKADQQVVFAVHGSGRWIALYNSDWIYDTNPDEEMAALSKTLNTCCINMFVFDSDVAVLHLLDACNHVEDTVVVGDMDILLGSGITPGGKPAKWIPWLKDGVWGGQLTAVWKGKYVFAEEAVSKTGDLLGMEENYVRQGYNYLDDFRDELTLYSISLSDGTYTDKDEELFVYEGPTRLAYSSNGSDYDGKEIHVSFCNIGGPSKGMAVVLDGADLLQKNISVEEVTVKWYNDPQRAHDLDKIRREQILKQGQMKDAVSQAGSEVRRKATTVPQWTVSAGRRYLVAMFKDCPFPLGLRAPENFKSQKKLAERDEHRPYHEIYIKLDIKLHEVPKASLEVMLFPLEHWNEGKGTVCKGFSSFEAFIQNMREEGLIDFPKK